MTRLSGRTVLVLEDDALIGIDLAQMLEEEGASVMGPFRTTAAAFEAIGPRRPDFALLDFNLGGPTSEDLADHLHASGMPFAFLSGYARDYLPNRYADVPIIAKPVSLEAIVTGIETVSGA